MACKSQAPTGRCRAPLHSQPSKGPSPSTASFDAPTDATTRGPDETPTWSGLVARGTHVQALSALGGDLSFSSAGTG